MGAAFGHSEVRLSCAVYSVYFAVYFVYMSVQYLTNFLTKSNNTLLKGVVSQQL